ncbi:MAG: AraC family transcriptional regulator [Bacteroidota bacterium]
MQRKKPGNDAHPEVLSPQISKTDDISVKYYAPSADLYDIVKYYWIVEVKDATGDRKLAKISPTGYPELIFHFGDSVCINTGKGNLEKQSESIIAGQITQPVVVDMNPHLSCFCVKLHAWSLSAIFGMKSTNFVNQAVCLDDVIPNTRRIIYDQLSLAADDATRIHTIENHLRALKNKNINSIHPVTAKVISAIRQGDKNQIIQLANDFHVSSRTLQRRLNDDIGISAKMFSRITRFNKAYHLIKNHQHLNMQDICFHLGYYDLPHLINEFREFSGDSPMQYFKNENVYNSLFVNQIKL